MKETIEMTGRVTFMILLGAFVVMTAVGAGFWWGAHHLAWWTFALSLAGGWLLWQFMKAAVEISRNSTSNRRK